MEKKNRMQSTFVVWLGALICCALWGSAFPCIKIGYQMFEIPQDAVATADPVCRTAVYISRDLSYFNRKCFIRESVKNEQTKCSKDLKIKSVTDSITISVLLYRTSEYDRSKGIDH